MSKENNDLVVFIGVKGSKPGISHKDLALIHEFGAGNMPKRDPLKQGMEKLYGNKKMQAAILKTLQKNVAKAGRLAGEFAANEARSIIMAKQLLGNAPITIAKKGFDWPLVDTGEYLGSIDYGYSF